MNTSQLECFLAVAKYLNFSKASEAVRLSQPAVSRQINALEDELGTRLFIRTSRKVELTIAGLQFIDDAKGMITIAGNAKSRFRTDTSRDTAVVFNIGCHDHFEQLAVVALLSAFIKEFPHLHPTVKMAPPPIMEPQLEDRKLDVILGFQDQKRYERMCTYHELTTCPIACVCRKDHPFAGRTTMTGSELAGNHILYEVNMGPHPIFRGEMPGLFNETAADLYYVDGFDSAMTMVKAGVGFTLNPDILCCRDPELCYITLSDLPRLSFGVYANPLEKKYFVNRFIRLGKELLNNGY